MGRSLVSEGFYSGYSFSEEMRVAYSAGLFLSYKIPHSFIGLEARMAYDAHNSRTEYKDIKNFKYTIDAKFQAIGASAHVRGYIFKGLYISAGIGYGWNIRDDAFSYSSNSKDIDWGDSHVPSDKETSDEINEAFSPNGLVYLPLSVGYEHPLGFCVELFYRKSLNDVVSTNVNRHDFGEADNRIDSFGLLLGWSVPMDSVGNHKRR